MKKFLQLLTALSVLVFAVTAFAVANSAVDWQRGTITVKGMGVKPPNAVNEAQAMMMARRSAVVDGYRQLAEAIKGVYVDSESTVENFLLVSDITTTKVNAVIQDAQVISERDIPGGGYEVTMRISMFGGSNSLAEAVLPRPEVREDFPQPVQSIAPSMPAYDSNASVSVRIDVASKKPAKPAPTSDAIGGYTGLIVDCRGLNLNPVMSPVIKNENSEPIYGHKNLDPDYVIEHGMAAYTSDLNDGTERAGSNPLVVKAVKLENHNGTPVISNADANRVLIENESTGFLEKTNVVFVR